MAEASPPQQRQPNRVIAILLLLANVLGTLYFTLYGVWAFLEEPANRRDGLWDLSLGVLWFLFFSWALRWHTHPKPVQ